MTPQLLRPFTDGGVYHGDPFGEPRQGRSVAHWYPESDWCASSFSTPILNTHPRTSPAMLLPVLDGVVDHVFDMHALTDAVSQRFSGPTPTLESSHRKWD